MFDDRDWFSKFVISTAFAAIPVAGFFLIKGWEFEISAQIYQGKRPTLPGWDRIPEKLARGIMLRLIGIIYNLPSYLFMITSILLWMELILRFFGQESYTLEAFGGLYGERIWPRMLITCGGLIYVFLGNSMYWSGYLRYIQTRRYSVFLEVFANLILSFRNFLDDLLVGIYMTMASLVISLLNVGISALLAATGIGTAAIPIIVPALTFILLSAFSGHLLGQLARNTV